MDKYLLIEAIEFNRGLMGPGSWNHTTWKLQNDGEYTISKHYNSPVGDQDSNPTIIHESGKMSQAVFEHLISFAKQKWHVDIVSYGYDGSAWEVRIYGPSGKVIKRWKEGYIEGQLVMEEIAKVLLLLADEAPDNFQNGMIQDKT